MQSSGLEQEKLSKYYTIAIGAYYEIARAYYTQGKVKGAQRLLHTVLDLIEESEAQAQDRLKLLLLYGRTLVVDHLLSRGEVDLMFATVTKAKQVANEVRDSKSIAEALNLLGQAHYFASVTESLKRGELPDSPQEQGKFDQAMTYHQQALKIREELQDTQGISESTFQIGSVYERWQQYEKSQEYYARAQEIANRYEHTAEKVEPVRHCALQALMKGDIEQALTNALKALSLREAAQFKPYLPLDHLLLRDIYMLMGDSENGQLHMQRASALASEMGYPELVASAPDLGDAK